MTVPQRKTLVTRWQETRDYWRQFIWRVPALADGTTIVRGGTLLAEEDYDIFVPANLIYHSGENGTIKIGAEVLNSGTMIRTRRRRAFSCGIIFAAENSVPIGIFVSHLKS